MSIDEILEKLPKLSVSELEEIENRIAFLKATSRSSRVKLITIHDEFYSVLERHLFSEHGIKVPNYNSFEKTKSFKAFDSSIKILEEFNKRYFSGLTTVERTKLYGIYCRIICDRAEGFTSGISLPILCVQVGKIPELFNRQFPGYIKSGLARAVIKI